MKIIFCQRRRDCQRRFIRRIFCRALLRIAMSLPYSGLALHSLYVQRRVIAHAALSNRQYVMLVL